MPSNEIANLYSHKLFLTNDKTLATSNQTAPEWAQQTYLPAIFLNLVVSMFAQFLIAYEHVLHVPLEWSIWSRILRRQKLTKAILPWSTLWLRYTTLALGIIMIIVLWDNNLNPQLCRGKVIPALFAFTCLVSISTGFVAAWRSRTIARAALTSKSSFILVRVTCIMCLAARLVSQLVAFTMQIKITNALNDNLITEGRYDHASCFATALLSLERVQEKNSAVLDPGYAFIALLLVAFLTDMVFAGITLVCIFKLTKSVNSHSSLLKKLLHNSIMLYALLAIVDLFGLIFYSITFQPNIIDLTVTGASVLMIRLLVKEQECIAAHSESHTTYTKTPWLTVTREPEKILYRDNNNNHLAATRSQYFSHPAAGGGGGGGTEAAATAPRAIFSSATKRRASIGGLGRGGGPCRDCARNYSSGLHVRRIGAGMTDIERVTVFEQGRSIDRSWPIFSDEDDEAIGGVRSLIAEWTRGIEGAMSNQEEGKDEGIQVADHPMRRSSSLWRNDPTLEQESGGSHPQREEKDAPNDLEDDGSSLLGSSEVLTVLPALNRLPCPAPAQLSRSRSSIVQTGQRHTRDRPGPTKTIF